jgi:hypothetical protein
MTTSTDPRGRLSECWTARQSALATAADSDDSWVRRHFYDLTVPPQNEPQPDDVLGGGFHNSVDERPAAPDIDRASATVAWPLDLVQIGWALTELLGAPTTTGAGPYVHTFTSAGASIPTTSLERKLNTGAFDGAVGLVARSLQFPVGSDRGYARVQGQYFARQSLEQYDAALVGATTVTPTLASRVPRAVGVISRDGSPLGHILSGEVTLTNLLGEDSYHGSAYVDDVQLEGRQVGIRLTGRFKGAALRDLGKIASGAYLAGTQTLALTWSLSASLSLVLTVRGVRFARTGVGIGGPGRLDVPLMGRGEVATDNPMVTAVLTNGQATYA